MKNLSLSHTHTQFSFSTTNNLSPSLSFKDIQSLSLSLSLKDIQSLSLSLSKTYNLSPSLSQRHTIFLLSFSLSHTLSLTFSKTHNISPSYFCLFSLDFFAPSFTNWVATFFSQAKLKQNWSFSLVLHKDVRSRLIGHKYKFANRPKRPNFLFEIFVRLFSNFHIKTDFFFFMKNILSLNLKIQSQKEKQSAVSFKVTKGSY